MAETVVRSPVYVVDYPPERQSLIVNRGLPGRWKTGTRDEITLWALDVGLVRDHQLWRMTDAKSWDDYVTRYLGDTVEGINAVITGVRELTIRLGYKGPISETHARNAAAEIMMRAPDNGPATTGRPKKGTTLVPLSKGGNDRLAARIKRDHPDIAAAVERGEYTSMRQAALEAGIIKSADPYRTACRLWEKMNAEQRAAFKDFIANWDQQHANGDGNE